ncbi:RecE family exodeoxyribonuclease [Buttiauxella gaviniae]|uniref:RecE family exodeoxyribonuclease n=1 Tax=Buttiauxella gaviniae TaxID=82990 RepID=UPI003C7686A8
MMFAYLIKARPKAGMPNMFTWFDCKSESRADREIMNILEDNDIETGRGADYMLPVRTNVPVFDDLPEERVLDASWGERYELADDSKTWQKIVAVVDATPESPVIADAPTTEIIATAETSSAPTATADITTADKDLVVDANDGDLTEYPVAEMAFGRRLLSQLISTVTAHHIKHAQRVQIMEMSLDTDNSYVQNLLLAARNAPGLEDLSTAQLWEYTYAIKTVFPMDKRHELTRVVQFSNLWLTTEHIDRGILVREWTAGNYITSVPRTPSGATAGGLNKTDRSPDLEHTLDTLDIEIAGALLPMDFDIYNIPGSIYRRAKEMIAAKESPWKEWSRKLRHCPGILDYSRAAIFAVVRSAAPNIHMMPGTHQAWISAKLTETDHANPSAEILAIAMGSAATGTSIETSNNAGSEQSKPDLDSASTQPEVKRISATVFSIEGLMGDQKIDNPVINTPSNEVEKQEKQPVETVINEPVEATNGNEIAGGAAVSAGESSDADGEEVLAIEQPAAEFPAYFEPGRYEGLPNDVYHGANGISSTQVKDARVSLMYFEARHVSKTIQKARSPVLDMGNLVHALALQPEDLDKEFSVEPVIPDGAFTTTATIRAFLDEYNAYLPPLMSADDIKAALEEYNATLPAQVSLGASLEETGQSYMVLPTEYQRIEEGQKQTATAMKACIKEYNATLPPQVKTTGSREALLEQLAIINPDLVAQEAQKPQQLKVSGTKSDLMQVVKSVRPDAIFADELLDAWRENPDGKVLVTRQQLSTALSIQKALLNHPTAGMLLTHANRAVEVSYFGIDEETGLEIRVRPDLEIEMGGPRIGADLKTISMWNIKQEGLRAKLHREIIDRDYHLSAAMYCETAALDQFFWIFVNKDENYHWIAIIEASPELLELGMLEYRKAMRAIANGFDTNEWPAPITEDYSEELNDFDLRRLESLRLA